MTDAEFRRRAHAWLVMHNRHMIHGGCRAPWEEIVALLAAGPEEPVVDQLARGIEALIRGPCVCDIVGHAENCPARPAVLVPRSERP